MQEIITNQTLAPLSDVTVIKRGQTKTPFYGYKIGMVMRALGADEQLTKNVSWFLVNAFSDQVTVTTAEIANAICAALNRAGRTDLATAFTEHR
ncbi:anaerobic ribonucleoside-triphosphate reductase, partial [Limosilactobacillus fermentum]|nr:anaerobic ribonucleoside-triphosphate reductase [Limosilactobacillus fermentum]